MDDFERLGVFYLGREVDAAGGAATGNLLLYDSKDLVTHAVCVGMTGSGKTGLGIGILEEAAIDGIPSLVVDPKGDLTNLLLTFPDLRPEDFLPWVDEGDARRTGRSLEEFAADQASLWEKGLAEWGQDGSRIRRLRESAEFSLYTPGSSAGLPVSILRSFAAPDRAIVEDADLLRERVNATVSGLLGLLGIEADPVRSREHILLATLMESAWRQGRDIDLAGLILAVQSPPLSRVGVFDLESFYPSRERHVLARQMNNLLAAPGFGAWLEGEPLDVDRMLYTAEGKPRVSIFSLPHLSDPERIFFVSLLLAQLLGWMRGQPGTTSLRALFYMDEIFGYFPPVANPPTKGPLLALLKQARAFGLGIVLATQNPVDLDYKGLSNTGTWFLGRLQTERDKERVLEGLEGAAAGQGGRFDRRRIGQLLAGLGSRVFLMHNVHEDAPVLFRTRWTLSYLRGPLGREQIRRLTEGRKGLHPSPDRGLSAPADPGPQVRRAGHPSDRRPVLPPDAPQCFLPVRGERPEGARLCYEPMLLGIGKVYCSDSKAGISTEQDVTLLADFSDAPGSIDWGGAAEVSFAAADLEKAQREEAAQFGELPPAAGQKEKYAAWGGALREWLLRNRGLTLYRSPSLKLVSGPGEQERDFRIRAQLASRESRDREVERLRRKYAQPLAALEERLRRARQAVEKEEEQAKQQTLQAAFSLGATVLGALMGRKAVSQSTIGRASTTASRAGRVLKESKDVGMARETVQELERKLAELQGRLAEDTERIRSGPDPLTEELETLVIRPKRSDVSVTLVTLAWAPLWRDDRGGVVRGW